MMALLRWSITNQSSLNSDENKFQRGLKRSLHSEILIAKSTLPLVTEIDLTIKVETSVAEYNLVFGLK